MHSFDEAELEIMAISFSVCLRCYMWDFLINLSL